MNNLEDCFVFYLQHDETMPVDFWTNVADLWNKNDTQPRKRVY
jgi:hypothetical protein